MSLPTNPNLLMAGGTSPYFNVQRSLRFRASATAYLNRNMSAANTTTWTVSFWFKPSLAYSYLSPPGLFEYVETTGAGRQGGISPSNAGSTYQVSFYKYAPSTYTCRKIPSMVFRDPSAWYHAVFIWNTTSATAEDRAQIWINGSRVTSWSTNTNPSQNETWLWSVFTNNFIGAQNRDNGGSVVYPWDGYLSELNFIDGQALDSSYFGYTDPTTGVWMPKKYAGSYGTAGFYLTFQDNSSNTATTIGKDYSGNGNNWTPNNISVTSGVTYDSMLDAPTNWGDGGNGRGNYAVLNPLSNINIAIFTLSGGNLNYSCSASGGNGGRMQCAASFALPTSGKYYWEATLADTNSIVGLTDQRFFTTLNYSGEPYYVVASPSGAATNGMSGTYSGTAFVYSANDVIGMAVDMNALTLSLYRNGTFYGTFSGLSSAYTLYPYQGVNSSGASTTSYWNFGQRPFAYTPPSGFKTLNTLNLPTPTILNGAKYMAATTYTGTGSSLAISNGTSSGNNLLGVTMQPDLVWIKSRSNAYNHCIFDSVRGATNQLSSDSTSAQTTYVNSMSAFNTNGFQVISDAAVNGSGVTLVGWQWNAGSGVTSSNTSGSITSTVSVNRLSGFSVLTATAPASGSFSVGHGLNATPGMIIVKATAGGTASWVVWHSSLGSAYYTVLNTSAAQVSTTYWGTMTSTLVNFAATNVVNPSSAFVCYCFAPINGYSFFGSYTGNGSSDGPMVWLGFRPRWIMVKLASGVENWYIEDSTRGNYNANTYGLYPNLANAEQNSTSYNVDFLSNGFKIRTADASFNSSGGTYIYAAFAENPFNVSRAR